MKRTPLANANNHFTMVPHMFFDVWLKEISGSECVILCWLIRKTLGYQKEEDWIAVSQFLDATTLSKNTVLSSIESLVKMNMIIKRNEGPQGAIKSFYRLNMEEKNKKVSADDLCAVCKINDDDLILHQHHIIHKSQGGPDNKDNLIRVCPNCHSKIHKGKYTAEQLFEIKNIVKIKTSAEIAPVQQMDLPGAEIGHTIDNITIDKDNKEYMSLASLLKDKIIGNNPKAKVTVVQVQKWAGVVRLMVEKDNRTLDEIKDIIVLSQAHDFWHKNILGMEKLRKQFDRLTLEKNGKKFQGKGTSLLERERNGAYAIPKKSLT